MRPAPQGRGYRVRKRSNHVTVIVDSKYAAPVIPEKIEEEPEVVEEAVEKKKEAKPKKTTAKKTAVKKPAAHKTTGKKTK